MKTEQDFGYVIVDAGFEYNDNTYDIGHSSSTLVDIVYPSLEEARRELRIYAKGCIGNYSVGILGGWDWSSTEPAIAKAHEFGLATDPHGSCSYNLFFDECDKRGVDFVDYLPDNLYQILPVRLGGSLKMTIEVPDEEIEKAKSGLLDITQELA